MKKKLLSAFLMLTILTLFAQNKDEVRTIRLMQDDAQLKMASKLYELKHVKATDVRPYVENAVKRFSSQSKVERVNYSARKRSLILVTTGSEFFPYIDDMIAKIDRPGKIDRFGSVIEGTGISRIAYRPNYRAAEDIVEIINGVLRSGEGVAYLNKETNTIFWKDDRLASLATLAWVQKLDRPVPQVNLRLNYYEVRESKLRDLGLDYLAWKNGPGLNLFEAAYNGGKVLSNEAVIQSVINGIPQLADYAANFSTSWGYGGFFTAPQFDMSFIRILQQSGNAKLAANSNLTFVNTPVYADPLKNTTKTYRTYLVPEYQNIVKDGDDKSAVTESSNSSLELTVTNPVICFGSDTGKIDSLGNLESSKDFYRKNHGGVIFDYTLSSKDVLERNNRGEELANASAFAGSLTLGFQNEKILAAYIKENKVEQTVGIPFLIRIPILKYLFGTTTILKERTYIFVTAEAGLVHPELMPPVPVSPEVISEELN